MFVTMGTNEAVMVVVQVVKENKAILVNCNTTHFTRVQKQYVEMAESRLLMRNVMTLTLNTVMAVINSVKLSLAIFVSKLENHVHRLAVETVLLKVQRNVMMEIQSTRTVVPMNAKASYFVETASLKTVRIAILQELDVTAIVKIVNVIVLFFLELEDSAFVDIVVVEEISHGVMMAVVNDFH